ncbi:hypothetical protein HK100_012015 [Physocladia obscura]|uniref:OPT superfamily oligopeptide transporter n=1 Tax=Physocladia obscura TaxID=109957 RepID=A0AAD5T0E2_9FUNG|nr:hypothetical protein HK100_012015 [Physocladia obscura]
MTTAEEVVNEKAEKIQHLIEEHPEFADDAEVADITDIEERIDFIVPLTDDPSTPTFTVRALVIGTVWCIVLSVVNVLLSFRSNPFGITASVAVILSYPMGLAWAAAFPSGTVLNPGPFNVKEHALIYLLASTGTGTPYGLDNIVVQAYPGMMGNSNLTFFDALAFSIVTQFIGYGLSGLTRRFLVKPTAMWWPQNLSLIALLSSFHKVETGETAGNRFKTSRFQAFWIAFAFMFVYTWIPEYFMPVLQSVSTLCLFSGVGSNSAGSPNKAGKMTIFNAVAASTNSGVGLLGTTFDWVYLGSGLVTSPFWATLVYWGGTGLFQWILVPILWSANVWGLSNEMTEDGLNPSVNSPHLYNGNPNSTTHTLGARVLPVFFYNVSNNYNLNLTAYEDVAPVHLTGFFALTYGGSFLSITASLVHVIVWYGKDIYRQSMNAFRQIRDEVDAQDKHVKMMEAYPDVPEWAYLLFLAVVTILAIAVSVWTPFNMPWWAIFFNLFLCGIFLLPFGVIQAISGFSLGLNVLTEFLIGLMLPGQTVAVMAFKSWGTNNLLQALYLTSDLKLGQYLHIAPYALIFCQFFGTLVNAIVSVVVAWYLMFNAGDLLGTDAWDYINYQIFYSAGGIWGAIGPQRFFGIGSIYQSLLWCFLVGAISPVLPWLGNKYIVKSKYWHYINFPLLYNNYGPGGYQNTIVVPLLVAYFGQVYIFNHQREWYQKYMYVIGTAFDASSAIAVTIIAVLAIFNYGFNDYNVFNPNQNNVAADYYCVPDAGYLDFGCEYYLEQGMNTTNTGVLCVEPSA